MAEDATGVYAWSADEDKQINDYAEILKANVERWTFWGKQEAQKIAIDQHERDEKTLQTPRENWLDPDRYFAETRRMMAARIEAFRRAGLQERLARREGGGR